MFTRRTSRSIAYRARVLHLLDNQITQRGQCLIQPRKHLTHELAVMAVAGHTHWNAVIAWQAASKALPTTPKHALPEIVDLIQWELLAA
jgi:hypothetical protein